jgi:hypothetical protein
MLSMYMESRHFNEKGLNNDNNNYYFLFLKFRLKYKKIKHNPVFNFYIYIKPNFK